MKNYDDLQRFKEKTQTLDIAFKDMSGQTQEAAEQSKWALIRQLASEDQQTPFGGSQRIDLPEPQPVRADEFSAPAPASLSRQPRIAAQSTAPVRTSILDSLAAPAAAPVDAPAPDVSSLFPPPLPHTQPQAVEPVAARQPEQGQPAPAAFQAEQFVAPVTKAASVSTPSSAPAPAASTEPGRFGALFRSRNSEPVSLSKETLLKPLLEKIALCR